MKFHPHCSTDGLVLFAVCRLIAMSVCWRLSLCSVTSDYPWFKLRYGHQFVHFLLDTFLPNCNVNTMYFWRCGYDGLCLYAALVHDAPASVVRRWKFKLLSKAFFCSTLSDTCRVHGRDHIQLKQVVLPTNDSVSTHCLVLDFVLSGSICSDLQGGTQAGQKLSLQQILFFTWPSSGSSGTQSTTTRGRSLSECGCEGWHGKYPPACVFFASNNGV